MKAGIPLSGEHIVDVQGECIVLDQPFSFWGGLDTSTGMIIDQEQQNFGETAANKLLLVSSIKGSTAGPGALFECLSGNCAPLAVISSQFEPVIFSAFTVFKYWNEHTEQGRGVFYAYSVQPPLINFTGKSSVIIDNKRLYLD